jgi:hypothetical protein
MLGAKAPDGFYACGPCGAVDGDSAGFRAYMCDGTAHFRRDGGGQAPGAEQAAVLSNDAESMVDFCYGELGVAAITKDAP